jgi:hypothetical protein
MCYADVRTLERIFLANVLDIDPSSLGSLDTALDTYLTMGSMLDSGHGEAFEDSDQVRWSKASM